MIDNYLNYVNA